MIESYIAPGDGIRRGGVLFPLQALSGPDFTGTMGPEAHRFVAGLSDAGGLMWHDLPCAPADEHGCPYNSPSALTGDPRRIDIRVLAQNGVITPEQETTYFRDIAQGVSNKSGTDRKLALLADAFVQFDNDAAHSYRERFERWSSHQGPWLNAFAAFSALAIGHGTSIWQKWLPSARDHAMEAITSIRTTREYKTAQYIQWIFHEQATDLKAEANQQSVGIIGDVPFYVSGNSADVWANRKLFSVDAGGYPLRRSGVPPDYFSPDGQLWGNPIYKWHDPEVREDLYKWYGERFKRVLEYTNTVRIDHARALANYFVIDDSKAAHARDARLEAGPGDAFLDYLGDELGRPTPFIAEDLGDIDQTVRDIIIRHELPGIAVPQFAPWGNNASSNEHYPDNTHQHRVIYSGTHDNDTVNHFVAGLGPGEAAEFNYYFGVNAGNDPAAQVIEKIWDSPAGLAIASIADILSMGADGRYNTPGSVCPDNWSRRYSVDALISRVDWLKTITQASGRTSLTTVAI